MTTKTKRQFLCWKCGRIIYRGGIVRSGHHFHKACYGVKTRKFLHGRLHKAAHKLGWD